PVGASAGGSSATLPGAPAGSSFHSTKREADRIDANPSLGVMLWKQFIQKNPDSPDKAAAEAELKTWEALVEGNAEKVNGKWISGPELEALQKKVGELLRDSYDTSGGQITINGVKGLRNLEEIIRIYPQSFEAHFELGYYYLLQARQFQGHRQNIDRAIRSLQIASRLRPDVPEVWTNLAIAYNFRSRYEEAVQCAWRAAEMVDEKEFVQNLANAIYHAPPRMVSSNARVRAISEQAQVLFRKHGIGGGGQVWLYMRPNPNRGQSGGAEKDDRKGPPGIFGNGTGFFISEDGYIMTNEHVARPGDYLIVRLHDGSEYLAQRVVIDDEQDIAILKIKTPSPQAYIRIAAYDAPPIGTDVTVLGYPLHSAFGLNSSVKITRGIVTAYDRNQAKVDVTVDAQVNPGNSGGPMVDKYGNLLALVAMKTLAIDPSISSYGLGLSPGRLRTFFTKHEGKFPGLTLEFGKSEGETMTTEQLARRSAPGTVCILRCRGGVPPPLRPEGGEDAPATAEPQPDDAAPESPE
ncbi:MAG TPA: trypsin-like peptidase domain-containing protein, partial [Tepidisphaeraceae bacterium]|nr:trypsin-like peptidase domain-containing protein [Tepidisphaeraceae bacterium]